MRWNNQPTCRSAAWPPLFAVLLMALAFAAPSALASGTATLSPPAPAGEALAALPPRPAVRVYPPVSTNPPWSNMDRFPWMVPGEILNPQAGVGLRTMAVDAPPLEGVLDWEQAHLYVGQEVTVRGLIAQTGRARTAPIHFLNFLPDDRSAFHLVVFSEAFEAFGGDPATTLDGQFVQATGVVRLHRGRPQIGIRDASQIQILDAASGEATSQETLPVVPWNKAAEHMGKRIIVEGMILNTHNTGEVCFLNFTRERGDHFYIVMFRPSFAGFDGAPETALLNKTIRVTGEVSEHRGRPQMRVQHASQIQVMP